MHHPHPTPGGCAAPAIVSAATPPVLRSVAHGASVALARWVCAVSDALRVESWSPRRLRFTWDVGGCALTAGVGACEEPRVWRCSAALGLRGPSGRRRGGASAHTSAFRPPPMTPRSRCGKRVQNVWKSSPSPGCVERSSVPPLLGGSARGAQVGGGVIREVRRRGWVVMRPLLPLSPSIRRGGRNQPYPTIGAVYRLAIRRRGRCQADSHVGRDGADTARGTCSMCCADRAIGSSRVGGYPARP